MELQEQLRDIKSRFRMAMNGVASKSIRDKGLCYKVNFGIELPRLREIAACYEKDHRLAQTLWKEPVRESKILAGMLQPVESFIPELADIWIDEMPYPEIAEFTCMNLFQYLPYASDKVFQWIADERPYSQACGYLVLTRLFAKGLQLNERAEGEYLDQALSTIQSAEAFPQRAAFTSLLHYVRLGKQQGQHTLKILAPLNMPEKPEWQSLYEEIKAETEMW